MLGHTNKNGTSEQLQPNGSDISDKPIYNYDFLLENAGGFGYYQYLVLCMYTLNVWAFTTVQLYMVFGAVFPASSCTGSQTEQMDGNESTIGTNCSKSYAFYSIVAEWDLDQPALKYIPSIITTIQMSGVLVGPLASAMISDRHGRRRTLIAIITFKTILLIARGFSVSWQMFTVLTFFLGTSGGALLSTNYIYFTEHCVARWRIIFAIVGWLPGCIIVGLLALATKHWQTLNNATLAFTIPALIIILFLRPSPKWNLARNNPVEAGNTLAYIANINRAHQYNPDLTEQVLSDVQLVPVKKANQTYNYWHLFYSKKATLQCLAIMFSWSNATLVYYGITFGMSTLAGDLYVNYLASTAIPYIAVVTVSILDLRVTSFGRRWMLLPSLTMQCLCMIYVTVAYSTNIHLDHPISITVVAIAGLFVTQVVWVAVEVVIPEFYPTEVRTMGYGINNTASRCMAIVAPQIMHLMHHWLPAPFVLLTIVAIASTIFDYFLFPETKNCDLPDLPSTEPLAWCSCCQNRK